MASLALALATGLAGLAALPGAAAAQGAGMPADIVSPLFTPRGLQRSDAATEGAFPDEPSIDDILAAHQAESEESRIVGGSLAQPGQWPSVVALFARIPGSGSKNFCGGTVIGSNWVLTAAHCAAAMKRADSDVTFFVREGTQDLQSSLRYDSDVVEIIPHPRYQAKLYLNDVALLKVEPPLRSPRQPLVASAYTGQMVMPRRMATVTGFGVTKEGGSGSSRLRQVDIPVVSQQQCRQIYGADKITEASFCAGETRGGKDSCQGDSGGPLFLPNPDGSQVQAGVVSWGKGCARAGFFGVYASVGNFESWVRSRVKDAVFVDRAPPAPAAPATAAAPAAPVVAPTQNGPVALSVAPSMNTPAPAAPQGLPAMTNVSTGAAPVVALVSDATDTPRPSAIAQVTVDFVQPSPIKVGQFVEVRVTSSVAGSVVVYNENPDGRAYQLYPSKAFPAPGSDPAVARIAAGETLTIPSAAQRAEGYRFVMRPPLGTNKLRAVVVPTSQAMDAIVRANFESGDIRDLSLVIDQIVAAELGDRGPEPVKIEPVNRGSAERVYEIIGK